MLNLLFLDIDGVLNAHERFANGYSGIDRQKVAHLNRILSICPDVQIVLSSAWRYSFQDNRAIETLLCVHGVNAFGRIHGRTEPDPEEWTPDHPQRDNRAYWDERGLEWRALQIRQYLVGFKDYRIVVLDDLPLAIPELVKTEPRIGLTLEISEEVCRRFWEASESGS